MTACQHVIISCALFNKNIAPNCTFVSEKRKRSTGDLSKRRQRLLSFQLEHTPPSPHKLEPETTTLESGCWGGSGMLDSSSPGRIPPPIPWPPQSWCPPGWASPPPTAPCHPQPWCSPSWMSPLLPAPCPPMAPPPPAIAARGGETCLL